MGLVIVTPPESDPITLEQAKAHLRVDFDDEDDNIAAMVRAATIAIANRCDRTLMPTTYDLYLDAWPTGDGIELSRPPLISVDSVNYTDPETHTEVEWPSSNYEVDAAGLKGWVVPGTGGWPTTFDVINSVRIQYTAGYPLTGDSPALPTVPEPIIMAIKLTLSDLYENRGSFVVGTIVAPIPQAVFYLLLDYQLIHV